MILIWLCCIIHVILFTLVNQKHFLNRAYIGDAQECNDVTRNFDHEFNGTICVKNKYISFVKVSDRWYGILTTLVPYMYFKRSRILDDKIFVVVSELSNKRLVIESCNQYKSLILGYQQRKLIKDVAPMNFDYDPLLLLSDDESNNRWEGFQEYKTFQFRVRDSLREVAKKLYDLFMWENNEENDRLFFWSS